MEVTIIIETKNATKEDIRSFLEKVKVWDMLTPMVEIVEVRCETDTVIPQDEFKSMYEGIFPEFEDLTMSTGPEKKLLSLGSRGITVDGQLIGTCSELALTIGEATDEDIKKLEEADAIALVRIRKG